MGQDRPPTLHPGHDIRISGNKSALEKDDARFIDFTANIKPADIESFLYKPTPPSPFHYETTKGKTNLKVDDLVLEKIDYEITRFPLATESQSKTFWKTKDHAYFFMFRGGLAVAERLFGPFRLKGEQFVFAGKPR